MTTTTNRAVSSLTPHPLNSTLYGDSLPEDLISSIKHNRVLQPLTILDCGTILSGHRRYAAAKELGHETVPVIVVDIPNELDQRVYIVTANVQRQKSNLQLAREAQALMNVEAERAKLRQSQGGKLKEKIPGAGQSRDLVGDQLGMSGRTVDACVAIAEFIDENPQPEDSQFLKRLERGFSGAHKLVKEQQAEEKSLSDQVNASSGFTLEEWKGLDDQEKARLIEEGLSKSATMNEQKTDSIEWARHSWNPVTGCLHNCGYCYAADITRRFGRCFKPRFHPDRLSAPLHYKSSEGNEPFDKNVFVCSMADLFGPWVPSEWVEAVLDVVRKQPDLTFLFLTKNPKALTKFSMPDNVMLGATVDRKERVVPTLRAFDLLRKQHPKVRTWLSVEPMLERFEFDSLRGFEVVVIGGCSRVRGLAPFPTPSSWLTPLIARAHMDGVALFLKTNLEYRPKYMPGGIVTERDRAPDAYFELGRKLGSDDEAAGLIALPLATPGGAKMNPGEQGTPEPAHEPGDPQTDNEGPILPTRQQARPQALAESRNAVQADVHATSETDRHPTAQS